MTLPPHPAGRRRAAKLTTARAPRFLATDMRPGGRRLFIASLRDVTERRAHTDAVEYQALHDGLTGLPNRTLLRDRLDREVP